MSIFSKRVFQQPNQSAVLNPILTCDLIQAMEIVDPNFSLPDIYLNLKVRWASVLGSDSHHPSPPVNGAGIVETFLSRIPLHVGENGNAISGRVAPRPA